MDDLAQRLKERIIAVLDLQEVTPGDIDDHAPLFGDGLGLDSIDALELVVLLEKDYNIRVTNVDEGTAAFRSITTLVTYIQEHRVA